jgi:hypothetical protein
MITLEAQNKAAARRTPGMPPPRKTSVSRIDLPELDLHD